MKCTAAIHWSHQGTEKLDRKRSPRRLGVWGGSKTSSKSNVRVVRLTTINQKNEFPRLVPSKFIGLLAEIRLVSVGAEFKVKTLCIKAVVLIDLAPEKDIFDSRSARELKALCESLSVSTGRHCFRVSTVSF